MFFKEALLTCLLGMFLKVSIFDSIVQGGDSVWEGLRVYDGKIFKLEEHLDRSVKIKDLRLMQNFS